MIQFDKKQKKHYYNLAIICFNHATNLSKNSINEMKISFKYY